MKVSIKTLLLITLLILFYNTINAQINTSRMFIFGHSLLDHRPPAIATPSNETTIPHWVYLLAQEAGHEYSVGGQYGFLPQHANLPPISQWGYDLVPGVWESDTEPFSDADITTILLTAGNFMQWQSPDLEYPTDPGVTPISATEDVLDWVNLQEDSIKFYIYENWPDMAGYLNNGFPPSPTEFAAYNDYTLAAFHDWWLAYQDALLLSRPDDNIRMIPVGPILSKILTDLIPNQIPFTELYEDDAPHGRPTIYFLAGLITYMAVFEEEAPASFDVPSIVHATVQDNYTPIVNFIWNELQSFNDSNGVNRVFCETITNSAHLNTPSNLFSIYPNPSKGSFNFSANPGFYTIEIMDAHGIAHQALNVNGNSATIDISNLSNGLYFIRIKDTQTGYLTIKKVLKLN